MTPSALPWHGSVLALSLALGLTACKIVEHKDQAAGDGEAGATTDAQGFDAARYLEARWEPEIIPFVMDEAAEITDVLPALAADRNAAGATFGHREGDEGKPWSFLVVARGTPLAIDRSSRAAVMPFDLAPEDGTADLVIQIGPVIRGTALRDSLPFLSFVDVVNQMEWAAVSRQMHDRLNATLLATTDVDALVGREVEIRGAFTDAGPGAEITLTPIVIMPLGD